jgi:NADPH:quinone reductase-like Zn-dependent oxidoreductase
MRTALIEDLGSAPILGERDSPLRTEKETLIRVTGAAVGHLDETVASGRFGTSPPLPYVPCGDGAGVVVESETWPAGTPVWVRGGGLGLVRDGLAADLAVVPDDAVHPCPEGADPLLAACFFSPATSAAVAVHDLGRLTTGSRVLVTGAAGAVGSLAVQLAAGAGAHVVGSVGRPERVTDVDPAAADVVVGTSPIVEPVDVLIDTIGGRGLEDRLGLVAPGGRAVLVGYTAGNEVRLDLPTFVRRDVALLPLNMIRRAPAAFAMADDLLVRLSRGELRLEVTSYPLSEVARAWTDLCAGQARGRVVLVP